MYKSLKNGFGKTILKPFLKISEMYGDMPFGGMVSTSIKSKILEENITQMKNLYKLAMAVLIILLLSGVTSMVMAKSTDTGSSGGTNDITIPSSNSPDRKYIIESRRYIGEDGKTTFDKWLINGKEMMIDKTGQYVVFYPLEGEFAGKRHYIPFSNIHIIREI